MAIELKSCADCDGKGQVRMHGKFGGWRQCSACAGSGEVRRATATAQAGDGLLPLPKPHWANTQSFTAEQMHQYGHDYAVAQLTDQFAEIADLRAQLARHVQGGAQPGGYCADCNTFGGGHAPGKKCDPRRFHPAQARATPQPAALQEQVEMYTCIGKGGIYELVGNANGAGPLRGSTITVYRDTADGMVYFREPSDFVVRMQRLATVPAQGDLQEQS